jgi:hypothetical protein
VDLVGGLSYLHWGDYFSEGGMLRVEVFPELCGGEFGCVPWIVEKLRWLKHGFNEWE